MIKNKMGIAGIPGTFPTWKIQEAIQERLDPDKQNPERYWWTRTKINNLYFAYKEGVITEGLGRYEEGNTKIGEYVQGVTGYSIGDVRIFLWTVRELALEGSINSFFWNFEKISTTPGAVIEQAFTNPFKTIEGISKQVKWIGLFAVLGIGLYFAWPYLGMARRRISRKRRK